MSEFIYLSKPTQKGRVSVGDVIEFPIHTVQASGGFLNLKPEITTQTTQAKVVKEAGGGLYGKVLITADPISGKLLDYVIKTASPGHLSTAARMLNWGGREFAPQVQEAAAIHDHQTMKLIHGVVGTVTEGEIYAPDSFGFTRLPNSFAQIIERVSGRGPRLNTPSDLEEFKATQRRLFKLGISFGLEHAAQIHPGNPKGLPNLWKDDENCRFIWLDNLAAMRHSMGRIFSFQKEMRDIFYPKYYHRTGRPITFNRIHVAHYMHTLSQYKDKFSEEEYWRLMKEVQIYQSLLPELQQKPPRNLSKLGGSVTKGSIDVVTKGVSKVGKGVVDTAVAVVSPAKQIEIILSGLKDASEKNLIPRSEYLHAKQTLESDPKFKSRFITLRTLFATHEATGIALAVLKLSGAFSILANDRSASSWVETAGIFVGGWAVGGSIKYMETKVAEAMSGYKFKAAARACLLPFVGDHVAVPAQMAVEVPEEGGDILHYKVRKVATGISNLLVLGGENSDLEAWLMRKYGRRIEKWLLETKVNGNGKDSKS